MERTAVHRPPLAHTPPYSNRISAPVPYLFYIKPDQRAREVERLSLRCGQRWDGVGYRWGTSALTRIGDAAFAWLSEGCGGGDLLRGNVWFGQEADGRLWGDR